jgi:citrate synthase
MIGFSGSLRCARDDGCKLKELNKVTNERSEGLAGITAGKTAISFVDKEGIGLNYRGYSVNDLAENAQFE